MDLFQTYESEFEELVSSIKKKTVDAAGSTGGIWSFLISSGRLGIMTNITNRGEEE